MKRPRITIRRLMVAIACVGLTLAYGERRRRYERLAARHAYQAASIEMETNRKYPSLIWVLKYDETARFHTRKSEEYKRAAPWPWIVVAVEEPPTEGWPPNLDPDMWRNKSEAVHLNLTPP
jgi:hypothetical protein